MSAAPRIITADGEYQASKRLATAANVMARDPTALQLRLLQTVVEVASERNSALIMPVPVELLRFFDKMMPAGPGAGLPRCGPRGCAMPAPGRGRLHRAKDGGCSRGSAPGRGQAAMRDSGHARDNALHGQQVRW